MNALTTQNTLETFHNLIDQTDRADGTKDKYKRAITKALQANVDLSSRESIRAYAQTLSKSGKAHLKAVITLLTTEYKEELEANVTNDTLADTQVKLMRLNAIAKAVKVEASKGQKAHTWLTQSEVKTLLDTVNTNTIQGKRDKIMLGLLVGAGLRREELTGLTFEDVLLQPLAGKFRTVLNIRGKGAKDRAVPINDRLATALDDWKGIVGNGYVARSITKGGAIGESLSAIGVFHIVRQAGESIGKPELAPHDLRRTYAQLGYEAGVPITQISKLLGHASVATTQRYLNLDLNLETTVSDFIPF